MSLHRNANGFVALFAEQYTCHRGDAKKALADHRDRR
jgi:hypothetical protein